MSRFSKQVILPEIKENGQRILQESSVLIVGAGGLGTPLAVSLAALGIGTMGIADPDFISESNLHRQFMFTPADIDKPKAKVLAERIQAQNPDITLHQFSKGITEKNADEIASDFDLICDCTDSVTTRLLLDNVCNLKHKALLYGAVKEWTAYITLLHGSKKISMLNLFSIGEWQEAAEQNCALAGIFPPVCGIAGNIMATEVVKYLLKLPHQLDGTILCIDALTQVQRTFTLKPNPS